MLFVVASLFGRIIKVISKSKEEEEVRGIDEKDTNTKNNLETKHTDNYDKIYFTKNLRYMVFILISSSGKCHKNKIHEN